MCVLDLKKVLLLIRVLNWFMVTFHSYVEELEAPLAGTKPMSPHHRSPGGDRQRKRKQSTILLKWTGKGHRQSDQHLTVSKATLGKLLLRDEAERMWAFPNV